jgi:zinc/manganese transport system substrate-binding protein
MKEITMKRIIIMVFVSFNLLVHGKLKVVTSYRYIGDIVKQVAGDLVSINALAKGSHDPHFITPKPSFIAKLRKADLLVINGGQLEVGWLPPVMRQANNPKINTAGIGFMSLIDFVKPIDMHNNASRSGGDVHPEGNPHIQLDPYNIPVFAKAISAKLCQLDPNNCDSYKKNLALFTEKWQGKIKVWDQSLNQLKGVKVVEYHKVYDYLFHRYNFTLMGTLEPLPGISPTTKHIAGTIKMMNEQQVGLVLQDVYHSSKTARYVAFKSAARVVIIPHDVGAVKEVTDIFSLYDELVRRLTVK